MVLRLFILISVLVAAGCATPPVMQPESAPETGSTPPPEPPRPGWVRPMPPHPMPPPPDTRQNAFAEAVVIVRSGDHVGSGFIASPRGYAVTHLSLVDTRDLVTLTMRNGRELAGRVIARDAGRDLALIKVAARLLPYLILSHDDQVSGGDDAVAIGTFHGFAWGVSSGEVKAQVQIGTQRWLQTDIAPRDGLMGGPLVSLETGNVIALWVPVPAPVVEGQALASREIIAAFGPYLRP